LGVFGCHRTVLLTRKGSEIRTLEEVRGKPIGYVTNALLFKKFGGLHGEIIVQVSNGNSLFLMLVHDRLDGFFVSDIVLDAYIKDGIPIAGLPANWREKLGPTLSLQSAEVHLRMNKESLDVAIAGKLKNAITALKSRGRFEQIYLRYGSQTHGYCP
jgi:ABC-type amino acid transport substrate-binding protein